MDMVAIYADFEEFDFIANAEFQTDAFQRLFRRIDKDISSVLDRTDQVVDEETFVMTFEYVVSHYSFNLAHWRTDAERRGMGNQLFFEKFKHLNPGFSCVSALNFLYKVRDVVTLWREPHLSV